MEEVESSNLSRSTTPSTRPPSPFAVCTNWENFPIRENATEHCLNRGAALAEILGFWLFCLGWANALGVLAMFADLWIVFFVRTRWSALRCLLLMLTSYIALDCSFTLLNILKGEPVSLNLFELVAAWATRASSATPLAKAAQDERLPAVPTFNETRDTISRSTRINSNHDRVSRKTFVRSPFVEEITQSPFGAQKPHNREQAKPAGTRGQSPRTAESRAPAMDQSQRQIPRNWPEFAPNS